MADFSLHSLISGGGRRRKRDFLIRNISGSVTVAQRVGGSRVESFFQRVSLLLSYTTARAYGLFLLGFGLLSVVTDFLKDYLNLYETTPLAALIAGAVVSIIAIPLIAVDRPLALASQEYMLTDYVVHEFFCIKRVPKDEKRRGIPAPLMLVFGLILALVGNLVPMLYILAAICGLFYFRLAMLSPEFSFFGIFMALPYFSLFEGHETVLSALVVVTLISYFRKVLLGKRVFALEQYDVVILLMLLVLITVGLISGGMGSFRGALVTMLLTCGYALAGNLVTNRRLADAAIHALVISSVPVSVLALVQFAEAAAGSELALGGVRATLSSPEALAVFLIAPFAFSLYFAVFSSSTGGRVLYSFISVLVAAALFATLCPFALVAALIGLAANLAARLRRGSGILLGVLMLAPHLAVFLPEGVLDTLSALPVFERLGFARVFECWSAAFSSLAESLLLGSGSGGIAGAATLDGANLFLEIAISGGVLTLIVFIILLVIRSVHRSAYQIYVRHSQVMEVSYMCTAVVTAVLAFGVFDGVFSEPIMYYLFWCIFGIGSATLRIAKRERDDMVGYFTDGRDVDASSVDITLR